MTLGYQLDSELWSVRLGSPGETSMHELVKGKALGIPNEFRFHLFSKNGWKTAAAIRRQAAGRVAMKSTENGRRFFMDYRFI